MDWDWNIVRVTIQNDGETFRTTSWNAGGVGVWFNNHRTYKTALIEADWKATHTREFNGFASRGPMVPIEDHTKPKAA